MTIADQVRGSPGGGLGTERPDHADPGRDFIVDARSMSPEVQAEARRRGLIPDRPGRPANTDAGRRPTARSSDDEE